MLINGWLKNKKKNHIIYVVFWLPSISWSESVFDKQIQKWVQCTISCFQKTNTEHINCIMFWKFTGNMVNIKVRISNIFTLKNVVIWYIIYQIEILCSWKRCIVSFLYLCQLTGILDLIQSFTMDYVNFGCHWFFGLIS